MTKEIELLKIALVFGVQFNIEHDLLDDGTYGFIVREQNPPYRKFDFKSENITDTFYGVITTASVKLHNLLTTDTSIKKFNFKRLQSELKDHLLYAENNLRQIPIYNDYGINQEANELNAFLNELRGFNRNKKSFYKHIVKTFDQEVVEMFDQTAKLWLYHVHYFLSDNS